MRDRHQPHQIPLLFLSGAGKSHLPKLLYEKREEEWCNETRGRALFKIVHSPTRKVLHIYEWVSELMVQMWMGKIGLRKFLCEREVPDLREMRCGCGRGEETMRHILTECPRFKEMRNTMWEREVKKARLNWIDLRTILTTSAYV